MARKIYDQQVTPGQELEGVIKKCLLNHLLIYNKCLEMLYAEPETEFHVLKRHAKRYMEESGLAPVVPVAIFNELYYQHKKFKRNVKIKKELTNIQYLTFTVSTGSIVNNFTISEDRMEMTIEGLPGVVSFPEPLPDTTVFDIAYFNLSYSNHDDSFRLVVYVT